MWNFFLSMPMVTAGASGEQELKKTEGKLHISVRP
jgi:hypothetical protein